MGRGRLYKRSKWGLSWYEELRPGVKSAEAVGFTICQLCDHRVPLPFWAPISGLGRQRW